MIRLVYTITERGRPVGRLERKLTEPTEVTEEDIKAELGVEFEYMEVVAEDSVYEKV